MSLPLMSLCSALVSLFFKNLKNIYLAVQGLSCSTRDPLVAACELLVAAYGI